MQRRVDTPQPGFFKMSLAKGCPPVGCELRFQPSVDPETGEQTDRSPMWETWIDGKLARDPSPDPTAAGVWRVWLHATQISQQEYRYLVADRAWCKQHAPDHPVASPDQPVDIATVSPRHFLPRKRST